MKQALATAAVAAALAFGALAASVSTKAAAQSAAAVQKAGTKYHVVFHVTESNRQKWNVVLNNAGNLQQDLGKDNVTIEIVTHGPGIDMLKAESDVVPRLAQALDRNIALLACENTMRNAKVTKDDMYGGISYVRSGVTHILLRQTEGWQYLRP